MSRSNRNLFGPTRGCQDLGEPAGVERLDQVMVEADLGRAVPVPAESSRSDKHCPLELGSRAESAGDLEAVDVRQADIEQDHTKRMALYAQAEDTVLNDVAWVPIFFQKDAELVSPRVQGMRESLFGHLPHTTISMAK